MAFKISCLSLPQIETPIIKAVNLIIDQGNTQIKYGVFDKGMLIHTDYCNMLDQKRLMHLSESYTLNKCICSSVIHDKNNQLYDLLRFFIPSFMELTHHTSLPFTLHYKTPESLGKDRIAAVAGAHYLYKNKDVCIIDAGTAITYELLTKEGVYKGGNIAPGLKMRFKALHHFTSQLPEVQINSESPLIGTNTTEAIQSGVQQGIVFEMEGLTTRLKEEYPEMITLITGGDADFFARILKKPIFVHFNLVLVGLNRILEYNA
jgi:type III pantothenate kinase